MRHFAVLLLLALPLTACSSDDTDEPDASPAPPASSSTSSPEASTESSEAASEPSTEPSSGEAGGESSGSSQGQSEAELASVTDDALRVTPPLESYFFTARGGHATTIAEAVDALAANGLELSPGNEVGGYVYDEADEDFKLCIQGPTGAFATYDTSPMSLFESGKSGGCP